MTVAAVILSATAEGALADTLGQPRVRRLADIAWSGGALPVVVVAPDADGAVARALVGSEAIHGSPAPAEGGPAGQMVRGAELALAEVARHDRRPAVAGADDLGRAGDLTSLIEAHGTTAARCCGRPGTARRAGRCSCRSRHSTTLRAIAPDLMPPDVIDALAAAIPTRVVELGDPGVVHDADTPFADLPPYEGPPDPPAGHTHEWGDDVAGGASTRIVRAGAEACPVPEAPARPPSGPPAEARSQLAATRSQDQRSANVDDEHRRSRRISTTSASAVERAVGDRSVGTAQHQERPDRLEREQDLAAA